MRLCDCGECVECLSVIAGRHQKRADTLEAEVRALRLELERKTEALTDISDLGALAKWGFTRSNVCVDWKCLSCGMLYSHPDALPLMNMRRSLPADNRCDNPKCATVIAREALRAPQDRTPGACGQECSNESCRDACVYPAGHDGYHSCRTTPAAPPEGSR